MNIEETTNKYPNLQNFHLLAQQIVEGFISGMHKSPFHGFSSEFAEHKIFNTGDQTKNIDWKVFAKTEKLYLKKFDEETNMRCHIIIDNSTSMHYPKNTKNQEQLTKIGFSALAAAVLTKLIKKQRDAVGLSIYSDQYEFYAPEKGSDRHHNLILNQLEQTAFKPESNSTKSTNTTKFLHQIAEKIHRRSLIILFTDMFQEGENTELFKALQHLKHNKHRVIVFHVYDQKTELSFDFDNAPKKFIDLESGEVINIHANQVKEEYEKAVKSYFQEIKKTCQQYKIQYAPIDISEKFEKIMTHYLAEKQSFKN